MTGTAFVTAVALGGCSFAIQRAPHRDPGTRPVECTRSRLAPAIDGFVAFWLGLASVVLVVGYLSEHRDDYPELAVGAVLTGVPAIGYGLAARSGFASVERCERFNDGGS